MDWGATIVFILSIIGAVILSGGDVMLGIIAFLVIFCILAAIKGVMKFITRDDGDTDKCKPSVSTNVNAKTHIVFDGDHFMHTLDMVMQFLQAYSEVVPNEWCLLFISQEWKHNEYSDRYYVTEGYLKFELKLGCWWDTMLYQHPDLDDYMKSVFTFNPEDKTFTYSKIMTGSSTCCSFPTDEVNKMLQKYVTNYEKNHPNVQFERRNWGVQYSI